MSEDSPFNPDPYDLQSLEEIEGRFWGDPPPGSTGLVKDIHAWRQVPIGLLGAEGLRALLEQRRGTATLMPLALDLLEEDPLLEAIYYPGDLLAMVVHARAEYWAEHPAERARVERVLAAAEAAGGEDWATFEEFTTKDLEAFRAG